MSDKEPVAYWYTRAGFMPAVSQRAPCYNDLRKVVPLFMPQEHTFPLGARVTKLKGSSWTGRVVGHYTPTNGIEGVIVESENEPGSCQLYPNSAMRAMGDDE